MTTGKTIALTIQTFVSKVMSQLFNMLSRLVIAFLPRSKHQFFFFLMAVVTICSDFGTQENKVCHCFYCLPFYLPWSDGARCHDLCFLNAEFKPASSLSSFTFIKRLFSSSSLSAIRVVSSAYLRLLIFLPSQSRKTGLEAQPHIPATQVMCFCPSNCRKGISPLSAFSHVPKPLSSLLN